MITTKDRTQRREVGVQQKFAKISVPIVRHRQDWSSMNSIATVSKIVQFCGVSQSTISKLRLRYRDTHDVMDRPKSERPRFTTYRVDRSIRLATLRNRRITARSLQMRYLEHHGRRVSVQTIRNRLHASQLKSRKAAQKPLLTDAVTIEFIDNQSCLWAVTHYWHWEILANFCWTSPLFSGPYLSL